MHHPQFLHVKRCCLDPRQAYGTQTIHLSSFHPFPTSTNTTFQPTHSTMSIQWTPQTLYLTFSSKTKVARSFSAYHKSRMYWNAAQGRLPSRLIRINRPLRRSRFLTTAHSSLPPLPALPMSTTSLTGHTPSSEDSRARGSTLVCFTPTCVRDSCWLLVDNCSCTTRHVQAAQ